MRERFLASVVAIGLGVPAQESLRLPPEAAGRAVGQVATVCGEALDLGCHGPEPAARLTFLTPSASPPFSVAIPDATMPLSVPRVGQHEPQAMCVTGVVRPVRSGFQITVNEPNQLKTDAADRADSSPFGERLHRSCDGGVSIPWVLRDVKSQHTMSSMRRKVSGTITLQATVEIDGSVSNVVVVKALDPDSLDPAAVEALRQWRFVAGRLNGTAIAIIITVDMAFTLR